MTLTEKERHYCSQIADRIARARAFLNDNALDGPPDPAKWHVFLSELRKIQGNVSNDGSFVATLLAKQYLEDRFGVEFDAAAKKQGARGIDIDVSTPDGRRIVAELKTTVPHKTSDFGAQQAKGFKADFAKLAAADADYKFLFVTDTRAFAILGQAKYVSLLIGVHIVNVATGEAREA